MFNKTNGLQLNIIEVENGYVVQEIEDFNPGKMSSAVMRTHVASSIERLAVVVEELAATKMDSRVKGDCECKRK